MVITIIVPKRHDYLDDKALLFSLFFFLSVCALYVPEKNENLFFFLFICTFIYLFLVSQKKMCINNEEI
jgi:hypothetical protein